MEEKEQTKKLPIEVIDLCDWALQCARQTKCLCNSIPQGFQCVQCNTLAAIQKVLNLYK